MIKIHHDDISIWVDSLDALKPEFTIIPVWNTIQFFQLKGKHTVMIAENLEPIKDVRYSVKSGEKFFVKTYRNYSLDELFFYRRDLTFSGADYAIESLRRYVDDRNVSLLLTKSQFDEINETLARIWKSHFVTPGRVQYKHFIALLNESIRLEDYKSYSQGLLGSKTVVSQFETRIRNIWDEIYKLKT